MAVNNLYQPWRAILSMINQCLTSKTSRHDRPRYPVLQMLWGIITSTNVDYAELMWEEFIQAIQTFLTDKANLGSPTKKGRKDKPHVILYCRFTKLIIYKADEVFGMPFPNEPISNNIRNAPYYNAYLEMITKHDQKVLVEKEGKRKTASAKQPKPKPAIEKSSKPAPAPKPKVTKEKPSKASTAKPPNPKPAKEKSTKATPLQKAEPVVEANRPLPVVEGKGKAIVTKEQAAQSLLALHTPKRRRTTDQFIFQRRTPGTEEASTGPSPQPQDDTSANIITEELGEDVDKQVNLEEKTAELDQDQAVSDLGEIHKSRPPPEQVFMDEDQARPDPGESGVALAGPDPKPMHDEFMANLYSKVQESLKFLADEHVILENPLSSTETLSSMNNLEDAYIIGDQFINDKSTKDELRKLNGEAEVVSMVTVPIYQASSSVPPLSTPVIDLSPPKPASSTTQKFSDLEQRNKNLDNTTQNIGSRVFTLELRDLPHKIDETVKEAVQSGTYKSLPEHITLYEDLEASMARAQREEFLAEKDKSRKRCLDNQDPPPPPIDLDLSKKKQHDSGASGSSQPPAPQSSAWKKSDTKDTPSSSSKQQSGHHSEKSVEDIPMLDTANISDSQDNDSAHLLKIKPRSEWLKPILEKDRPETLEPDWIRKKKLSKTDLEGPTYKVAKTFYENNISLQLQMKECHRMLTNQVNLVNPEGHRLIPDVSKPLPLGGPPGQVTIQSQFFFNKDLEYLISGDKGRRSALSISKLKAAQYLDFGLEDLVPSLWIKSECEYDISAAYGISHWWFKRKEFYITKHSAPFDHSKSYYQEYISQGWLHNSASVNNFEDLTCSTFKIWDVSNFLFKEDYTIVSKPRAIIYRDRNDQKKMMLETEVHKFSDGTLQRILDKLDHMVKDFKLYEYNKGMETRIWSEDNRRRSKDFMELHRRRSRSRSRSRIREVEEAEEEANHIKLNCFCSDEYPFRGKCKESTTSSHLCTYFTHYHPKVESIQSISIR
ncbi:hypothetical protein Tco_0902333 [Tanacetum coccineum]